MNTQKVLSYKTLKAPNCMRIGHKEINTQVYTFSPFVIQKTYCNIFVTVPHSFYFIQFCNLSLVTHTHYYKPRCFQQLID